MNTPKRQLGSNLLVACGGVVIGILASAIVSRHADAHVDRARTVHVAGTQAIAATGDHPVHNNAAGERPADSTHVAAERLARYRATIQNIRAEPLDPSWSASAGAALTREFGHAALLASSRLVGLECRTTACVATVEWDSFNTAAARWPALLASELSIACGTRVLLPEPTDRRASYRTDVILDCSTARRPSS